MKNKKLLEGFGKLLISEVRDEAIEKYEMTIAGSIKSKLALEIHEQMSQFNKDELSLIRKVVINTVDEVLYNFLWMIEQHGDDIELNYEDITKKDVRSISDGLSGEIFTEDGWIAKFSKYKENY